MKKYIFIILLTFAFSNVNARIIPKKIIISGSLHTGSIDGFVQIPSGGRPGTASLRRPTLSELGINHNINYSYNISFGWSKINLYGEYQYIRPNDSVVLNKSFITHGVFIPVNSHITTNLKFDIYSLGGKYNFSLFKNRFRLAPVVEFNVLNFSYKIPNFIAPRAFNSITGRIGIYGAYYFDTQFFVDSTLLSSIPIFNLDIITANVKVNYTLFSTTRIPVTLFAGYGYLHINYEDQQILPNYIRFDQSAFITGLSLSFGHIG